MFAEDVLEAGTSHRRPVRINKQFGHAHRAAHRQPGPQVGGGFLPEWQGPLPPTLSVDTDTRRPMQAQVGEWQRHQLGHAEAAGEAEVQHRAVTDTEAGGEVRGVEECPDLPHRQVLDERLIVTLLRNRVDLSDLGQRGADVAFDVVHEGLDRGEPRIAGRGAVAALVFEVREEVEDQRGIELLEAELGGPQARAREGAQQPVGVGVGLARVRTVPRAPPADARAESG